MERSNTKFPFVFILSEYQASVTGCGGGTYSGSQARFISKEFVLLSTSSFRIGCLYFLYLFYVFKFDNYSFIDYFESLNYYKNKKWN